MTCRKFKITFPSGLACKNDVITISLASSGGKMFSLFCNAMPFFCLSLLKDLSCVELFHLAPKSINVKGYISLSNSQPPVSDKLKYTNVNIFSAVFR